MWTAIRNGVRVLLHKTATRTFKEPLVEIEFFLQVVF